MHILRPPLPQQALKRAGQVCRARFLTSTPGSTSHVSKATPQRKIAQGSVWPCKALPFHSSSLILSRLPVPSAPIVSAPASSLGDVELCIRRAQSWYLEDSRVLLSRYCFRHDPITLSPFVRFLVAFWGSAAAAGCDTCPRDVHVIAVY